MHVLRKLLVPTCTAVALLALAVPAGAAGAAGATLTPVPTGNVVPTGLVPAGAGSVWFSGLSPTLDGDPFAMLGRVGADGKVTDEPELGTTLGLIHVTPERNGVSWLIQQDPRTGTDSRIVSRRDGAVGPDVQAVIGDRFAAGSFATDAGGRLWIADARLSRVTRVGADLAVTQIPLEDRPESSRAGKALRMAAGNGRTVWVADGPRLTAIAGTQVTRRVRLPFAARAIAVDGAGIPWVVGATGRIARVSAGRVRTIAARVPGHVGGTIVAGPRGHLWLTVPTASFLMEVTRGGRATLHALGLQSGPRDPDRPPRALVADAGGRLWILNRRGLARVNLDPRCRVPDVAGASARVARATMSAAGCRGVVTGVPASADPDRTLVARQAIAPGGAGARGMQVELRAGTPELRVACRFPAGATEVVSTSQAAVWRSDAPDGQTVTWWVCRGAERRVLVLHRGTGSEAGDFPRLGPFALVGTSLAYVERYVNHYGGGYVKLVARDLADPRSLRTLTTGEPEPFSAGTAGAYELYEVATNARGFVAWTDQEDEAHVNVLEPGGTVPKVVATAPAGSLSGLGLSDTGVQWKENGSPHAVGL